MSSRFEPCPVDCKVYVGDLGRYGNRRELESEFGRFGRLRGVWVATNPPGFAFVMFDDPRDAKDAVRGLNGRTICGRRVRVELSTGHSRRFEGGRRDGGGGGGGYRGSRFSGDRGSSGGGRDRRDGYGGGERRGRRYSRSQSRSPPPRRSSPAGRRSPPTRSPPPTGAVSRRYADDSHTNRHNGDHRRRQADSSSNSPVTRTRNSRSRSRS